ncbi:MAG TPA: cupin domain-containing protein [Acidobacteriota bacterium]|nr:cupin domain-containing protein [Acidobacteriota bacterium]HOT01466.1 cupin domain-containing protein [Acidobacteriota bacterium]HQF86381.1 cupin domain-containing protein [Acidobacteriota bacterium]HQG90376.1 cupin domain-containing protein [Acidobacteriota bacterium]HQK86285.1 cupin domain-containing protein [Acidobacteriota bacterium]
MRATIHHVTPDAESFIPEGCFILELSNSPDDPDVSIARARVAPGATTRWHRLTGTVERYVILTGAGRVEVGDLPPQDVTPGDVVLIPPACRQRIANTGSEDLIFLAVCTPRFQPTCYKNLETECRHGDAP